MKALPTLLIYASLMFWINVWAQAAQMSETILEENCAALEDLNLKDTYIISASIVPAEDDLPEYCFVTGYILPAIHFAIRMPTENWNGKFLMDG